MFLLASIFTAIHQFFSLKHVEELMGTWGYPLLFGLLFSCGLGLPLPEDIPLLLGGYFIAIGKMHLVWAAIAAWCGIIGGDCMLYWFGYHYGLGITRVPFIGKHVTASRIQYAERLFQKYGTWVVAVGRLFAGIRGAMVVAAGTIRFSLVRFLIADGLAAIVSGGLFMALGYWAGIKLGDLEALSQSIKRYEHYVLSAVVLGVIGIAAWIWWRKKKHAPPVVEAALEKVVEKAENSPSKFMPRPQPKPQPKPPSTAAADAGSEGTPEDPDRARKQLNPSPSK
jgi:membrane protein DedA with SNARE-associated domain